jgi:NAD(P)-dependent dehydrogenase (short-subunit alcohol dehydrogenase family)
VIRRIWTAAEIPSQAGKTAIVTGGSSGLGFETARALARAGAEVVVASLNPERGAAAVERIRAEAPESAVEFVPLDTSSLGSVARFADAMFGRFPSLDVLVNCAGIGGFAIGWTRRTTVDGFERAFATNYLGHFALTGYLLPALFAAPRARVVSVSSLAHWFGRIQFDDLQLERKFLPNTAYEQSKLALLLFGIELHRRARAAGLTLSSIPVHPGISRTDIFQRSLRPGSIMSWLSDAAMHLVGQPAGQGALPVIFAAAAPDAESGRYYGPDGLLEIQGWPAPARIAPWVRDPALAERLWRVSEQLTGVTYRFEAPSAPPVSAVTEIDDQERSLRYDEPA